MIAWEVALTLGVLFISGAWFLAYNHPGWYRRTLKGWLPPLLVPPLIGFVAWHIGLIGSGTQILYQHALYEWPEDLVGRGNAIDLVENSVRFSSVLLIVGLIVGGLWLFTYLPSKDENEDP